MMKPVTRPAPTSDLKHLRGRRGALAGRIRLRRSWIVRIDDEIKRMERELRVVNRLIARAKLKRRTA